MGNNNSKSEQLRYDSKEWIEVQRSSLYDVMKNKTGQQGNLYHFNIKSHRKLEDQAELYHKRKSAANWVQVIGANLSSEGFGFCGTQECALVLTERIPLLLNSIQRLNRQQALVVLYNALRGYNDIARMIVPSSITDKMIGFTINGHTKVWINENFGMNYPSHFVQNAKLSEGSVISNILSAISPRGDFDPQLLNGVRQSGSFNGALSFIRNRGGVPENILESNSINVNPYLGHGQVSVLRDTTSLSRPIVQSVIQPATSTVVPQNSYLPNRQVGYQSWLPPTSTDNQEAYRSSSSQFGHTPGMNSNFVNTSAYQPVNFGYQPVRI